MKTDLFDYRLPSSLVAQEPVKPRRTCRLMVVNRRSATISHHSFEDFPGLLAKNDRLVFNDTKVLPARLLGVKEETGGRVEVFLLEEIRRHVWRCLVRPGARLRVGTKVVFPANSEYQAVVGERLDDGQRSVEFVGAGRFDHWLNRAGVMPLPPYIHRDAKDKDVVDYQTVFARKTGAVAAPTAGLHFDRVILKRLSDAGIQSSYITLHVGIGTFRPIKAENIESHSLHSEWYQVSQRTCHEIGTSARNGGRVIAVGTTVVRTLEHVSRRTKLAPSDWEESAIDADLLRGRTDLYIRPGHKFRAIDAMLTNFHLPKSSLLVLVSAFAGRELIMEAYTKAVRGHYRFYSYGDAMLIL